MMMKEDPRISLLGERVHRLQQLRSKTNTSFFHKSNETTSDTPSNANNINTHTSPEVVEAPKSTQFSDNTHLKLQSTVKLLSESLEEQGKLRALLEYTADPKLYNEFLNSNNSVSNSSEGCGGDNNSTQNGLFNELRFRSLQLEQERLLAQVIELRTSCDTERKQRIQLDKDLILSHDMLMTAQRECDNIREEFHEYKNQQNLLNSKISPRNQNIQLENSTTGRPPQHNKISRPQIYSSVFDNDDTTLPPLPSDEVENEEVDELALLDLDISITNDVEVGVNTSASLRRDTSTTSTSSTTSTTKQQTHSKTDDTANNKNTTNTSNTVNNNTENNTILLDIDLGDGMKDAILITLQSDAATLAVDFISKHRLPVDYFEPLLGYIMATQDKLYESLQQTPPVAEAQQQTDTTNNNTNNTTYNTTHNKHNKHNVTDILITDTDILVDQTQTQQIQQQTHSPTNDTDGIYIDSENNSENNSQNNDENEVENEEEGSEFELSVDSVTSNTNTNSNNSNTNNVNTNININSGSNNNNNTTEKISQKSPQNINLTPTSKLQQRKLNLTSSSNNNKNSVEGYISDHSVVDSPLAWDETEQNSRTQSPESVQMNNNNSNISSQLSPLTPHTERALHRHDNNATNNNRNDHIDLSDVDHSFNQSRGSIFSLSSNSSHNNSQNSLNNSINNLDIKCLPNDDIYALYQTLAANTTNNNTNNTNTDNNNKNTQQTAVPFVLPFTGSHNTQPSNNNDYHHPINTNTNNNINITTTSNNSVKPNITHKNISNSINNNTINNTNNNTINNTTNSINDGSIIRVKHDKKDSGKLELDMLNTSVDSVTSPVFTNNDSTTNTTRTNKSPLRGKGRSPPPPPPPILITAVQNTINSAQTVLSTSTQHSNNTNNNTNTYQNTYQNTTQNSMNNNIQTVPRGYTVDKDKLHTIRQINNQINNEIESENILTDTSIENINKQLNKLQQRQYNNSNMQNKPISPQNSNVQHSALTQQILTQTQLAQQTAQTQQNHTQILPLNNKQYTQLQSVLDNAHKQIELLSTVKTDTAENNNTNTQEQPQYFINSSDNSVYILTKVPQSTTLPITPPRDTLSTSTSFTSSESVTQATSPPQTQQTQLQHTSSQHYLPQLHHDKLHTTSLLMSSGIQSSVAESLALSAPSFSAPQRSPKRIIHNNNTNNNTSSNNTESNAVGEALPRYTTTLEDTRSEVEVPRRVLEVDKKVTTINRQIRRPQVGVRSNSNSSTQLTQRSSPQKSHTNNKLNVVTHNTTDSEFEQEYAYSHTQNTQHDTQNEHHNVDFDSDLEQLETHHNSNNNNNHNNNNTNNSKQNKLNLIELENSPIKTTHNKYRYTNQYDKMRNSSVDSDSGSVVSSTNSITNSTTNSNSNNTKANKTQDRSAILGHSTATYNKHSPPKQPHNTHNTQNHNISPIKRSVSPNQSSGRSRGYTRRFVEDALHFSPEVVRSRERDSIKYQSVSNNNNSPHNYLNNYPKDTEYRNVGTTDYPNTHYSPNVSPSQQFLETRELQSSQNTQNNNTNSISSIRSEFNQRNTYTTSSHYLDSQDEVSEEETDEVYTSVPSVRNTSSTSSSLHTSHSLDRSDNQRSPRQSQHYNNQHTHSERTITNHNFSQNSRDINRDKRMTTDDFNTMPHETSRFSRTASNNAKHSEQTHSGDRHRHHSEEQQYEQHPLRSQQVEPHVRHSQEPQRREQQHQYSDEHYAEYNQYHQNDNDGENYLQPSPTRSPKPLRTTHRSHDTYTNNNNSTNSNNSAVNNDRNKLNYHDTSSHNTNSNSAKTHRSLDSPHHNTNSTNNTNNITTNNSTKQHSISNYNHNHTTEHKFDHTQNQPLPSPVVRSKRKKDIRKSITEYKQELDDLSASHMDKHDLQEVFKIAIEVFDRATLLNTKGDLEGAVPLYENALRLFKLSNFPDLEIIQEEVLYWTSQRRG